MVAEELEALISLGMLNSRMKDYFDLWILAKPSDFEGNDTIINEGVDAGQLFAAASERRRSPGLSDAAFWRPRERLVRRALFHHPGVLSDR